MSVEPENVVEMPPPKLVNGDQDQTSLNGFSNGHSDREGSQHKSSSSHGHHKSSSKDKHRDKDRDRKEHKSSTKDKEHKSSHRDKDHKSSSSSGHKSSSKDKDRDKHRSSDKDKERSKDHKDKDRDRSKDHKSSSKDKHRDKERTDDKQKSDKSGSDREKPKEHKSSSSSKDKDRHTSSSKDKHRDKERTEDKDKERSKEHKSSSKDKHRDKDRDKERSSDDKHRSKEHKSSSKDKHRSDKDRDRDKHKSSSGSKDKDRDKSTKTEMREPPQFDMENARSCTVALERCDNTVKRYTFESDPLDISQNSSCDYSMSQFNKNEPDFVIKEEASDSEQENKTQNTNNSSNNSKRKIELASDDEEGKPLSARKKPKVEVKREDESEEEIPLAARKKPKAVKKELSDDEDIPLASRKQSTQKKKKVKYEDSEEEDFDDKPKKKVKKEKPKPAKAKEEPITPQKGGRKKKQEEETEVWKWWEEEKRDDGVKWRFLEHKGPVFAPDYEPLPKDVHFEYDGKTMRLSEDAEEIAGFYAKMLESDYCQKKQFNDNFFEDWRKAMTKSEREVIKDFRKCNFKKMHAFFAAQSEKNRNRTKEEKLALKEKNEEILKEYGMCVIDGHKEKIGNFKIEPPGLFRGRGEHPKMGRLKRRVMPEDVTINCSKDSKWPQAPKGHKWKEVRHDNTVTWLASWIENVQGQVKYVMLNPSSKLKGEKDWQKYETARKLLKHIDKIRNTYRDEWKSKEMRIRQRAVALYFIDKLALRAGNEKDEDQADTVGCCSLRVEHIELHREKDGKEYVVTFDFLGKDSIRYYNEVEVEKRVFKNLELFKENKKDGDDLFDRLNTSVLNEHLRELMEGLTAKVFRTFNASYTLQKQLDELTDPDASVPEKLLAYNRANRAVAILCNHQRAVPKTHQKSMETLKEKIRLKREQVEECEREYKDVKRSRNAANIDKKKKQLDRLKEQLKKLELQETDRDENKTIALGTSKLNYLDPRISVAWCKKYDVPIEKIFNKTQRDKFRWAIEMATEDYRFDDV